MLDLEENLRKLNNSKEELSKLKETINIELLQKELYNLKKETEVPNFLQTLFGQTLE